MGTQAPAIQSDQEKGKPKRMDLMRVLRAGIKESPLPPPPLIFEGCLENLQSSAPPELCAPTQISSVGAHVTSSPGLSSSSFDIESSFLSEPQVSPTPATEMKRTFSSSRFSSDTPSAETSES
ncbi:hypothetical protein FRC05_001082 [Tulasnella sp. 425]|nr:hypothetical protein FRC05_001082 [Tulasnella sp. 425]